jgi:hypothetical protein
MGEASHSSPLPLWERERVRGITEIAGIVTENGLGGQKRNRCKTKRAGKTRPDFFLLIGFTILRFTSQKPLLGDR